MASIRFEAPPAKPNKLAYVTPAVQYAMLALQHSPLVRHGHNLMQWRVLYGPRISKRLRAEGRRVFNSMTINKLVSSGFAVRDGDYVRLATRDSQRGTNAERKLSDLVKRARPLVAG